jgi:1-acyl-sn-glycerol-3-phosphate acyltransferase
MPHLVANRRRDRLWEVNLMKPYTAMVNGQPRVIDATLMSRPPLHLQEGDIVPASVPIKVFRLFVRVLFGLLFRVRVVGLDNVPRHPVIICFNHLGWAEAFLVLLYFPVEPRIYGIGHEHVSELSGFRHWLMDKLHVMIPMDISQPFRALRISEEVLRRGGSLLLSPEGCLGDREGDLMPLQRGAAHASLTTGVPLLPVGITGTKELWLRRPLTVRIGPPIQPADFAGDKRTQVKVMTAALDRAMRALLPGDHAHPRIKLCRRQLTNLF